MSFVNISQTTDPTQLLDDGVDAINTTLTANGYPGWTANDATLVVIMLSVIYQALADIANTEATVSAAIWRAYGTQIMNIPYNNGTQASVGSTWTFTSAAPDDVSYFIPAGTSVVIDDQFFSTQADYTANTGDMNASILLVSSQVGTASNGLGGVSAPGDLYQTIDWVASVTTTGLSTNGQDQEDDDDYQNRLVLAAQLQAPRPVVATDFGTFLLNDIVAEQTGVQVGRATAIDGYYPDGRALSTGGAGATALSCSTTSGSAAVSYSGTGTQVPTVGATVTGTGVPGGTTVAASPAPNDSVFYLSANATATGSSSLTVGAMSGYGPLHLTCTGNVTNSSTTVAITNPPYAGAIPAVGARVSGTGIPSGSTVASTPTPTSTSFALSAAATATGTAETITISAWTNVSLCNTTIVTDSNGNPLTAAQMDTLATFVATYRPQNWLTQVMAPSYTTIYVTTSVHPMPSADASSVASLVQSAIETFLSPANWGNPQSTSTGSNNWLNSTQGFNVVRLYQLVGIVESVTGVAYCAALTLGTSPSPSGTSDITLTGGSMAPLPTPGTIIVTTV